jgi:hypothetical protein
MYSETWPGFQFGHLAAKTGQILVMGPKKTYAAQGYTGKNGHSPWFTPGTKGYLLYADRNENEPVLDYRAQNKDKGMGFSRKEPPEWFQWAPIRIKAMVLAGDTLFIAGPPDLYDPEDPLASFEGRNGGLLWAYSTEKGEKLAEYRLQHEPVFDGMAAADGRLFYSARDGSVVCYQGK